MELNQSSLTVQSLKNYLRIDFDEDDALLWMVLEAGRSYISSQTGLSPSEWEGKEDLMLALLIICCEMYDNRRYETQSIKSNGVNQMVDFIISQYRMNLL